MVFLIADSKIGAVSEPLRGWLDPTKKVCCSGSDLANSLLMQDFSIIDGLKTGLAAILMPIFCLQACTKHEQDQRKRLTAKKSVIIWMQACFLGASIEAMCFCRGCYHGPTPNPPRTPRTNPSVFTDPKPPGTTRPLNSHSVLPHRCLSDGSRSL